MRFRIPTSSLLLLTCLIVGSITSADNENDDDEMKDAEGMQKVLRLHNLQKLEISSASKDQFATYMALFCLTPTDMIPAEFMKTYISWEKIEFLDSVSTFLNPSEDPYATTINTDPYFNHLGHNVISNCSMKDDKEIRDSHYSISQDALFDNYLYDQMTRNEWTSIPI